MSFNPNLFQKQIIDNSTLCKIFKCAPQGGMRRSLTTNTLVIIANHVESVYQDRWVKDIFHYSGMGLIGDQKLYNSQNKTLAESEENGIEVHLFEVFKEKEYTYMGRVILSGNPYNEKKPDQNGNERIVWVFPLRLADGIDIPINEEIFKANEIHLQKVSKRLSDEEILLRAKNSHKLPGNRQVISHHYDRDPNVAEYAKRRAKGICQLCKKPAPFIDKNGDHFLETHHIVWLSKGGDDTIENTVALCPNCHRKMHYLNSKDDTKLLKVAALIQSKS